MSRDWHKYAARSYTQSVTLQRVTANALIVSTGCTSGRVNSNVTGLSEVSIHTEPCSAKKLSWLAVATGRLLLALHGALQALHVCHALQLLYALLLQSWWPLMLEASIDVFKKRPLNISYTASKLHTKHLQQSV